jgi:FkbM family methyltransferase
LAGLRERVAKLRVREETRRSVRRLLVPLGFELRRINNRDLTLDALMLRLLREKDVTVVLDVGASHGGFVDHLRGQGYEGRVISFEPLPGPYSTLARRAESHPRWEAVQTAMSDAPGVARMRRSGTADTTSSLLPTTDAMIGFLPTATPGEEVDVAVSTVDEQIRDRLSASERVFLKVDAQGNELSVLTGAEAALGRAAGVLVELSFVELYEGQALFSEIVDWLLARNLLLLAMTPAFHDANTGRLLQVDALFGVLPVRRSDEDSSP